MLETSRCR